MSQPVQEKSSNKRIYLVIILLLLLLNIIGGFYLFRENKKSTILTEQKADLKIEFNDIMHQLEDAQYSLDTLKGQNFTMDSLLMVRQVKLDSMGKVIRKMLSSGRANRADLAKARELIAQLQSENSFYVTRIDSLNVYNKRLMAAKLQLETDLESEKGVTSQLRMEKDALTGKVRLASLLQANDLTVAGVKFRSSGKEIETNRIKRLEQLKVCFQTGQNKVTDPGPATLLLRLVSPQGATIAIQSMGSGVFTTAENGEEMQFTKELVFDYENENKKICAYWSQNIFTAGTYTAQIYQNGYLIGEQAFELK